MILPAYYVQLKPLVSSYLLVYSVQMDAFDKTAS